MLTSESALMGQLSYYEALRVIPYTLGGTQMVLDSTVNILNSQHPPLLRHDGPDIKVGGLYAVSVALRLSRPSSVIVSHNRQFLGGAASNSIPSKCQ